ncbi:MAG: hypothetical protein AAFN17_03005 [Pseudomonadota bacterium]
MAMDTKNRSAIREVVLRNDLTNRLLPLGYNVFLPVFDLGIDLIAHRESDGTLFLVQLKSRWSIDRKYLGRNIHVAFPDGDTWYLAPHDEMVSIAEGLGYTTSASWQERGQYHSARPSAAFRKAMSGFKLQAPAEA